MFVVLIRTLVLYLLIIVGIRLMGKRQVGELEPSELVLALIIADLASVPMQDNGIPLITGLIPIAVLLATASILSVLTVKSIRFRELLCGRPSIVIQDGHLLQSELRKNRFTIDELMEELRGQGYTDFSSIKYAVLETTGLLSVIPYESQRPLTAQQASVPTQERGLPVILISDGRILSDNLKRQGYESVWLHQKLAGYGFSAPSEIFLFTVDELGQTTCIPKEGQG